MTDYIDNNCHIDDQTAAAIDEANILGAYAAIQCHQNEEIITSSATEVNVGIRYVCRTV